jgi:putative transposase
MLLAHKIALDPNAAQRVYFARAAGTARFAWNWALGRWRQEYALKQEYRCGPSPSEVWLRRELNAVKREQFPWMYDVGKAAVQEAVIDLGSAYRAFFEGRAKYPRFKRKDDKPSFCAANEAGTFRADGKRIKLPVIGWVRMREAVRFSGPLKRATVSCEAGRWFVALQIDTDDVRPVAQPEAVVGIDLGVTTLATLSTGEAIEGPKSHAAALKRLRRANKAMARKRRGSRNARKAKARLARLHRRIGAIRRDATHKLTTRIAKTYAVIGIEDLNVRGMVRNRCLARAVSDGGFHEFRRQLTYKARLYGARIVVADRWYPSSKTCSCCGVIKETLDLAERTFRCTDCGFEAGRDVNAALNLAGMAASSAVSACGEARSGPVRKSRVKRASAKQEPKPELALAA